MIDTKQKFINKLYDVVQLLGGGSDILGIIGSFGDTLDDQECLDMITDWLKKHSGTKTIKVLEPGNYHDVEVPTFKAKLNQLKGEE